MSRLWPALDVRAHSTPDVEGDELGGRILAAVDEGVVTAAQEVAGGWRLFFATPAARDAAATALREMGGLDVSAADVPDEDWARRSQEGLAPVRVGRITISPPWAAASPVHASDAPASAQIEIVIQPSMGFGTGHHATTRLCADLLQRIDVGGRRALDVGTGSGVLAIAALRLGAVSVLAIDDDADAIESARENLELNGIAAGIELRLADFRAMAAAQFDLVTANLTGGLLARGARTLLALLAPGGYLVLSGITVEEEPEVRRHFEASVSLVHAAKEDGWVGLLLEPRRQDYSGAHLG